MRILWLKTELLHPVDKGGKIRTYHMLKELRQTHHITYLTLDDGSAGANAREQAVEYCHELITVAHQTRPKFSTLFYIELATNLFSPLPYFMQKYKSAAMTRAICEQLAKGSFDVLVCDFLMPAVNMPAQITNGALLFQHNVEAEIWRRHYQVQRQPLKKLYLYLQWLKTRAYERRTCKQFDTVVAVSREDAETMRQRYGLTSVEEIPTGVDVNYFQPSDKMNVESNSLIFTGSMDWLPNDDAIQFFTDQVLPLIRKDVPNVKFTVVGRNPSPALVELGRRDPGIIVTGRVDDVRPYLACGSAFVVPLRIGGGTRLKIYEAMAMGKPVVSTTVGAEGLPLESEVDLLIADTPEEFANAVLRVLKNEQFAQDLCIRGTARVRSEFAWNKVAERFSEIAARVVPQDWSTSVLERQKSEEEPTTA